MGSKRYNLRRRSLDWLLLNPRYRPIIINLSDRKSQNAKTWNCEKIEREREATQFGKRKLEFSFQIILYLSVYLSETTYCCDLADFPHWAYRISFIINVIVIIIIIIINVLPSLSSSDNQCIWWKRSRVKMRTYNNIREKLDNEKTVNSSTISCARKVEKQLAGNHYGFARFLFSAFVFSFSVLSVKRD